MHIAIADKLANTSDWLIVPPELAQKLLADGTIELVQFKDDPTNLAGGSPVREALVTLHQDLHAILANDWKDIPSEEIKRRINAAMKRSFDIGI